LEKREGTKSISSQQTKEVTKGNHGKEKTMKALPKMRKLKSKSSRIRKNAARRLKLCDSVQCH
jgi:hypothetical protein